MPFETHPPVRKKNKISVQFLIDQLRDSINLEVRACAAGGACLQRELTEADLHRPGLALAGYTNLFTWHRVQILGNTECEYLNHLSEADQRASFSKLVQFDIPVIFVTHGNQLPDFLLKIAEDRQIPVFNTPTETIKFMYLMRDFLEDQFALQTIVHGAMACVRHRIIDLR
jgi:HPr kinase/phosphorylase